MVATRMSMKEDLEGTITIIAEIQETAATLLIPTTTQDCFTIGTVSPHGRNRICTECLHRTHRIRWTHTTISAWYMRLRHAADIDATELFSTVFQDRKLEANIPFTESSSLLRYLGKPEAHRADSSL